MFINRRAVLQAALSPLLLKGDTRVSPTVPSGLWPVMLTPFHQDKTIDWKTLDRLTDWYLENGANGLFACCQSSEVWELTEAERLDVAARVVKRAGKTPVVAGGLPGYASIPVAEFVNKLAAIGVQAAVLTTCQLAERADSDDLWRERVEAILHAAPQLHFGLYEAPRPYKRLLTPATMAWAAHTNRFVFHKDTSCNLAAVAAKVEAVQHTPLRIFNAHVPILVDCIHAGGHGFSGIAANAYPNLVSHAVRQQTARVQNFLTVSEKLLNLKYPLSAKVMAALAGIPIQPVTRRNIEPLNSEQMDSLRALRHSADTLLS